MRVLPEAEPGRTQGVRSCPEAARGAQWLALADCAGHDVGVSGDRVLTQSKTGVLVPREDLGLDPRVARISRAWGVRLRAGGLTAVLLGASAARASAAEAPHPPGSSSTTRECQGVRSSTGSDSGFRTAPAARSLVRERRLRGM